MAQMIRRIGRWRQQDNADPKGSVRQKEEGEWRREWEYILEEIGGPHEVTKPV